MITRPTDCVCGVCVCVVCVCVCVIFVDAENQLGGCVCVYVAISIEHSTSAI